MRRDLQIVDVEVRLPCSSTAVSIFIFVCQLTRVCWINRGQVCKWFLFSLTLEILHSFLDTDKVAGNNCNNGLGRTIWQLLEIVVLNMKKPLFNLFSFVLNRYWVISGRCRCWRSFTQKSNFRVIFGSWLMQTTRMVGDLSILKHSSIVITTGSFVYSLPRWTVLIDISLLPEQILITENSILKSYFFHSNLGNIIGPYRNPLLFLKHHFLPC